MTGPFRDREHMKHRAALHSIYWLVEDAQRVLDAGDTAEARRQLSTIRDAVLRGLGGEQPDGVEE